MTKIGSVQNPDLASLLAAMQSNISYSLNCHQLGTVVSFNPEDQTAQVTLNVLRVVGDQTKAYPMLVDVPVFVPAGGSGCLTMPITPGDTCLVLFNDRDIDTWFTTGAVTAPNTSRSHSLADGLALVGFRSRRNPIADYSDEDVELRNGEGAIGVGDKISVRNDVTNLLAVLNLVVTALTALDAKTGPSAAVQIAAANTAINALLK